MPKARKYVVWFSEVTKEDVPLVGGKNSSLGEMLRALKVKGVRVPEGFATTSEAYWEFVSANNLKERIALRLQELDSGKKSLEEVGRTIRHMFLDSQFPPALSRAIVEFYRELSKRYGVDNADVAVRSSATAEDLPEASFAGQQETFLNITGEQALLDACRKCYASLFTDRAIIYRREQRIDHSHVALSIGVQKMVRSDKAGSGVIFTLDTESGFPDIVIINAGWGLGENVVQGSITPDQYTVFKPLLNNGHLTPIIDKTLGTKDKKMIYAEGTVHATENVPTTEKERRSFVLSDSEIVQLGKWALIIEDHYKRPMDIEWARDGNTNELFIVQARPETVQSRRKASTLKMYTLKGAGKRLATGQAIGQAIAAGKSCLIRSARDISRFIPGSVLLTEMTDPDWVPIMKQAKGIVTNEGSRTCHAAIVSRELGIPAIVATGNATDLVKDGQGITMSCAEGDKGYVYEGSLPFDVEEVDLSTIPETNVTIMMNMASPSEALRWWQLPCKGIGLARMEFIINDIIKIHPMALVHFDRLEDVKASRAFEDLTSKEKSQYFVGVRRAIEDLTFGYKDKSQYFVDHLSHGIAKIAAVQYPHPVIVRMSDFKTNEYANLIGGRQFEPVEDNPMLGWRGASRYYHENYRDGFALECRAMKRVRDEIGLTNVVLMIPFCRTVEEARKVVGVLEEFGLKRGENGLQLYMMAEIPSNIILASEFAEYFDGFSIGSNDLTQLTLGVDRDSAILASLFDERNESVMRSIRVLIDAAHRKGRKVGICGQAPSDYPDFAVFLVRAGIDSISINPDSVIKVKQAIAAAETEDAARK